MKTVHKLICWATCLALGLTGCSGASSSAISSQPVVSFQESSVATSAVSMTESVVTSYAEVSSLISSPGSLASSQPSSKTVSSKAASSKASSAAPSSQAASSMAVSSQPASSASAGSNVSSLAASSLAASSIVSSTVSTVSPPSDTTTEEMRGVWISYLELTNLGGYEQYKSTINTMFDKIKSAGMNTIFFHVRPFSDALYKSDYFPWSHVLNSGAQQGVNPGYDPLEYAIGAAHARGLKLQAWINPYRVWTKSSNIYDLSPENPARIWRTDADPSNDSWVLVDPDKVGIYYNPAIPEVRQLIVNGIKEIVTNYNVDGIHFDDYFYGSSSTAFDAVTYNAYKSAGGSMTLSDWRLDNVNKLIREVYAAVKSIRDIPFGISPQANINNNYKSQFADVNRWASESGYVDYLAPQVYFGYKNATMPFDTTVQTWRNLVTNSNTKLYIGLAAYKLGNQDNNAGASGLNEFIGTTDLMKRMVLTSRDNHSDGFIIYSYRALVSSSNQTEMNNLKSILN